MRSVSHPPANDALPALLAEVRACRICAEHLPLGPRPVVRADGRARILVAGQAPGRRVHASGVPFLDPSGDRLREWMGIGPDVFYDESIVALVPMGFCYPGTGAAGDLPPRSECAPAWRERLLGHLRNVRLTLAVGQYAHAWHLGRGRSVHERVAAWRDTWPGVVPLPHPSPRNRRWIAERPWFEAELLPALRERVAEVLAG